jgi:hypothetical protein
MKALDFIGQLLVLFNIDIALPQGDMLTLAILSIGFDVGKWARDADMEKEEKKNDQKSGKKESKKDEAEFEQKS